MTTKKLWILAIVLGLVSAYVIVTIVNTKEQIIVEVPQVIEVEEPETNTRIVNSVLELREGYYAISINISSDARGVAGFLMPGAVIDVYAFLVEGNQLTEETTVKYELLLEEVRVLASDVTTKEIYTSEEEQPVSLIYNTLTLEVTKDQIAQIISSQDKSYYAALKYYEVEIEEEIESGK